MPDLFACPSCNRFNRVRPDKRGSGPKCGHCKAALDTSGAPRKIDDNALDALIAKSPVPILVDFYADWCGPCRALAPHLEQVARNHPGELLVVKVDTQVHQRNAAKLGVQGIPAVYLYKGGRVVGQAAGMRPAPFWEGMVRPHLG